MPTRKPTHRHIAMEVQGNTVTCYCGHVRGRKQTAAMTTQLGAALYDLPRCPDCEALQALEADYMGAVECTDLLNEADKELSA